MYIYGKNVARERLEKKESIRKAYLISLFKDQEIISLLKQNQIKIEYVDKQKLDHLGGGNHQGIVLDVPDFTYDDISILLEKEEAFVVLLDHLEDPHNLGAIIRTCEAAGVDGIILPKDRSVMVTPVVIKTSAGAISNMKICLVTNVVETIKQFQKNGFWFVGTDMEGSDYNDIDYRGKIGIIIGNEGKGMSQLVRKHCDFIASIPMKGSINSLNASVAAGIVIFKALEKRK